MDSCVSGKKISNWWNGGLASIVRWIRNFTVDERRPHGGGGTVIAAGDLCAICQEKMHAPILLRCKHIFCEDCVSEWFERERTCPLCRALVKSAELKSYGNRVSEQRQLRVES
ncbi:hypothetical protein ZOSMA_31G01160 [Zostera marina]|uniref:RING-type domain-containing protein n=1 Tax=Zostera marina TaxID=29655 RepID=A0A0K9P8Y3_ZOSMR|nr:hypothetical protein ZOSMA_31G01160 [Zostera marina]